MVAASDAVIVAVNLRSMSTDAVFAAITSVRQAGVQCAIVSGSGLPELARVNNVFKSLTTERSLIK